MVQVHLGTLRKTWQSHPTPFSLTPPTLRKAILPSPEAGLSSPCLDLQVLQGLLGCIITLGEGNGPKAEWQSRTPNGTTSEHREPPEAKT